MSVYSVFKRSASIAPALVPERFSWFAALLPPVYALVHGLWLELVAFVLACVALVLSAPYIGDDATVILYLLLALFIGLEAASLRRAALARRGWTWRTEVIASAEDLAMLEALKLDSDRP